MSGEILGNYRILEKLGEGGMGAVYLAHDLGLEREVALKVIAPELARNPQLMARFRVEAIAQAKLNHSNITAIHSFDEAGGHCYIVMEFVDGNTLKNIIKEKGKIPLPEAINIFSQVLEGIAYAHSRGVVHRDIKPSNIFLSKDQRVKIGDFGIAKVAGIDGLTKMGSTMGSPLYSSPEQLLGKKTDARTDVYSLGITFYEMITGTLPIKPTGDSEYKVIREVLETTIRKPSELEESIPAAVDKVMMKSLSKSPEERFQSVKEFAAAVKELMKTASPTTTAPSPAAGLHAAAASAPAKMGARKMTAALDKVKSGSVVLGIADRKKALTVVLVLGIILALLIIFLITSIGNDQIPQTAHTGSSGQMPQPETSGTSSGISNFIQPGTMNTTTATAAPITTKPLLGTGSDLSNTATKMAGLIKNGEYSKAVGLGLQAIKNGVTAADLYQELARAYYYDGDKKNARLYYWKTLEVAQSMSFPVFYEYKKNTKADGSLAISKTNLSFFPTRIDMAQLGFSIPLAQIKSVSTDFIGDISGIFKKKKNRDNPTLIIKGKQKQKYQIEVGRADSKLRSFVKDIIDTLRGT